MPLAVVSPDDRPACTVSPPSSTHATHTHTHTNTRTDDGGRRGRANHECARARAFCSSFQSAYGAGADDAGECHRRCRLHGRVTKQTLVDEGGVMGSLPRHSFPPLRFAGKLIKWGKGEGTRLAAHLCACILFPGPQLTALLSQWRQPRAWFRSASHAENDSQSWRRVSTLALLYRPGTSPTLSLRRCTCNPAWRQVSLAQGWPS